MIWDSRHTDCIAQEYVYTSFLRCPAFSSNEFITDHIFEWAFFARIGIFY